MGLEEGPAQGLNIEDIPNILNGEIGDRYQFNPVSALENSKSSMLEQLENKIHCVAYFLEIPNIPLIPDTLLEKLCAI
ncbi:interferon-induced protein 44-like [Scleropages formosus]|uniref:interferon-induced protein 44-like n=1 Tax=Scleropages formosus TaxID=113540 RepID=UPI0010FA9803|nr:interferon-induced protein 44-like [Scleropages formosus]